MRNLNHTQPGPVSGRKVRGALVAAALLALLAVPHWALAAHAYDFQARMETVTALVDAARRLDESRGMTKALETIESVKQDAAAEFRAGRVDDAYARLDQAYVLVRTVVRELTSRTRVVAPMLAPAPAPTSRDARYDTLEKSVAALREAYHAIHREQGLADTPIEPQIDGLVARAGRSRAAGQPDAALRDLKAAYTLLQEEIVRLRGGQTLVRNLVFDSDRAEYEYEVDRHDTHLLLVEMLLDREREDPRQAARIREAIDASMRMHWVAHRHAAAGEYREAVVRLEQASDALIALIRSYGFDLP